MKVRVKTSEVKIKNIEIYVIHEHFYEAETLLS